MRAISSHEFRIIGLGIHTLRHTHKMTPFDTTRTGELWGTLGTKGPSEERRDFSKITQVDKSDNFVATKSKVKSRHRGTESSASGTGSITAHSSRLTARAQVPGPGLGSGDLGPSPRPSPSPSRVSNVALITCAANSSVVRRRPRFCRQCVCSDGSL